MAKASRSFSKSVPAAAKQDDPMNLTRTEQAAHFAAKLSADTIGELAAGIDRKEANNQAPVFLLSRLEEDYNEYDKDGSLSNDVLATFPRPGSENGNNPDKYNKPGKDADGAYKDIPTVWWNEFADATALGATYVKTIADCKESGGGKGPLGNLDDLQISTRKNRATGGLNYLRAAIKRAMSLKFQRDDLLEMGGVGFEFITEVNPETKEEEPTKAAKNIYIYNEKKRSEFKLISVGAFLAYDIKEAVKNGGTWSALLATAKRGEGEGDQSNDAGKNTVPEIKGIGMFEQAIGTFANYSEELHSDPKRADFTAIVKQLNGAGSDDFLHSLMTVKLTLEAIVAKVHRAAQRYDEMESRTGTEG